MSYHLIYLLFFYLTLLKCHILANMVTKERHLRRFCACRTSPATVTFPGTSSYRLNSNFNLCLHLVPPPSTLPRNTSFSKQLCLVMCPKNFKYIFLTALSSSFFTSDVSITHSLVNFDVHDSDSNLLKKHNYTAFNLLLSFRSRVQASHRSTKTDQMKHFSSLSRSLKLMFIFVSYFLIPLNLIFAIPNRFSTSYLHLSSFVTIAFRSYSSLPGLFVFPPS